MPHEAGAAARRGGVRPQGGPIWEGFRAWLRGEGLAFDYVLYSNYERQVEDLVAGRIGLAWNSQLLATQAADEARHVEVFSRRGLLSGAPLGTSGAGGRRSLQTLLAEPDFTTASFLLSVLGEGTFVDLLRFLHRHAPDPVTADVTRLALRDEARHVAFGVAHTAHAARADPGCLGILRQAVERRHAALIDTAGLGGEVFDAMVLLAAGSWEPAAIGRGWHEVQRLQQTMDEGRRRRLGYNGFPAGEAAELSSLHTRNFM